MAGHVGLLGRLPRPVAQDAIGAVPESPPSDGWTVDLEFHQLELRYERLRVRQPARERRLLASLADTGQQMPIVVVAAGTAYVVVDGHKRVRCLRRLQRDTVVAVVWEMSEAEALIFRHLLHTDATDSAFEQGWLLRTLHEDHGLTLEALARRFDRSVSWVSRRLSLVRTLPEVVQQHVQDGRLVAHAAMKYLVPLARANATECRALRRGDRVAPIQHPTDRPALSGLPHRARCDARAGADRPVARAARHRRHAARTRAPRRVRARGVDHRLAHARRRRAPRLSPPAAWRRPLAAGTRARLAALRSSPDGLSRSATTL